VLFDGAVQFDVLLGSLDGADQSRVLHLNRNDTAGANCDRSPALENCPP
jgi:hypothetical protein